MTLSRKFAVINRLSDQELKSIYHYSQPVSGAIREVRSGWESIFIFKNRLARLLNPLLALVLLINLSTGLPCQAQDTPPTEYQIKAAFLFNFAKFVDWPPAAFSEPSSPVVIGVLGKNVFGDALDKTLQNMRSKSINNHPVLLKMFHSVAEVTNCHVLFISTSEKGRLAKTLAALQGMNILTVSEMDDFISAGGMINFVIQDDKVHFEINNAAAEKAGLKISSKLLSLSIHRQ